MDWRRFLSGARVPRQTRRDVRATWPDRLRFESPRPASSTPSTWKRPWTEPPT
jgi:hypothetical protein